MRGIYKTKTGFQEEKGKTVFLFFFKETFYFVQSRYSLVYEYNILSTMHIFILFTVLVHQSTVYGRLEFDPCTSLSGFVSKDIFF